MSSGLLLLSRLRVGPLSFASWEDEEDIWPPALTGGPPETRTVSVGPTLLNTKQSYHLSHVTCHMSLQEQPQQQTLPFVTPPQGTVVGPRIPKN